MWWSLLSRVRVISDTAVRSLFPGDVSQLVLTSGGFRVDLAAQMSTSARLLLARAVIMVVLMAAIPPGPRMPVDFVPMTLGVSLRWSVPSVSRSSRIVQGVLLNPGVESQLLLTSLDPAWIFLLS